MKRDSPADVKPKAEQLCTTLPPRTFARMDWLKRNAGYSTKSQMIMKAVDILYERELRAFEKRDEKPVEREYRPWRGRK
jgi:hypothetical protein